MEFPGLPYDVFGDVITKERPNIAQVHCKGLERKIVPTRSNSLENWSRSVASRNPNRGAGYSEILNDRSYDS